MLDCPNLRRTAVAALLAACLGCGGKVPPTLYYALNLPAPPPASERLDHTAVLMPFRATGLARENRIVYRETPEQVGYYEYHRWAEDPRDSIAESLRREVLARGTFASVVDFDGRTRADYVLRGRIQRLEEVDYGGPVRATVELSLELVATDTGEVVWTGSATETGEVPQSDVRSVVERLGTAAQASIKRLAAELHRHLGSAG